LPARKGPIIRHFSAEYSSSDTSCARSAGANKEENAVRKKKQQTIRAGTDGLINLSKHKLD
jgi:hypothetical protein